MENRDSSQRVVVLAMDDLFFAGKIRATAEAAGIRTHLAQNKEGIIRAAHELRPTLIIVDLHARKFNPLTLASELKGDDSLKAIELLGFFSHVQTELQQAAQSAGFNLVLPRSAFTKRVAEILQGHR